eukprot:99778_1
MAQYYGSIKANECTSAAFVGIAAFVLSVLYRKKQTRNEGSSVFWNRFWQHATTTDNTHRKPFGLDLVFNRVLPYLHTYKPSNTVVSYISTLIDHHLNHILSQYPKCTNAKQIHSILLAHLQEHPLQILVPLCGSSYDLYYISDLLHTKYVLNASCFKIIGIDVSPIAITNFFSTNNMVYHVSVYNPKLFYFSDFYRVWIYQNIQHGISIIESDIFSYFDLTQALESVGIAPTPCWLKENSIDIIVDINGMSCCNPSDRKQYVKALKYWLSETGSLLLNTYEYDPKLSNYPPFTCHSNRLCDLFDNAKCKLLRSTQHKHDIRGTVRHAWLIEK